MTQPPKAIFGIFQFDQLSRDDQRRMLDICEKHHVEELDCGVIYDNCERAIATLDAPNRFILHGKAAPSRGSRDQVLQNARKSMQDLQAKKFDGYYLHAPDPHTPIEETCDAIQELYSSGIFQRFGLSNYLAEDVQRIYDYCQAKGYTLPSLYQGNYSAVSRRCEKDLFPVLRKLGISFYCYSPLGGGYFLSTPEIIQAGEEGRFDTKGGKDLVGLVFQAMFNKPSYLQALVTWDDLSKRASISKAELAFRWIMFHSALSADLGDGVILGADTPEQLDEMLECRGNGPLPGWVVDEIQAIWESCQHEASLDCVNGWFEDIALGRVHPPEGIQY